MELDKSPPCLHHYPFLRLRFLIPFQRFTPKSHPILFLRPKNGGNEHILKITYNTIFRRPKAYIHHVMCATFHLSMPLRATMKSAWVVKWFKIDISGIILLCQHAAFVKQSAITFIASAITPSVNIANVILTCAHIVTILLSKNLKEKDIVEYVTNHV